MFTEFEMEPHQECAYDHVIMYDGHTTEDQILGRFCGSKLPHPIMASDDQMLMVFKSDASVQRKGFFAQHHTGDSFILFKENARMMHYDCIVLVSLFTKT